MSISQDGTGSAASPKLLLRGCCGSDDSWLQISVSPSLPTLLLSDISWQRLPTTAVGLSCRVALTTCQAHRACSKCLDAA